jgi:hypothetical protein
MARSPPASPAAGAAGVARSSPTRVRPHERSLSSHALSSTARTGQYALRFDAVVDDTANKLLAPPETKDARGKAVEAEAPSDEDRQRALVVARERTTQGLTLDQRAVLLAAACSIDCDYFSRCVRSR